MVRCKLVDKKGFYRFINMDELRPYISYAEPQDMSKSFVGVDLEDPYPFPSFSKIDFIYVRVEKDYHLFEEI